MNKEILDTLDDLSKRPTTELAMRLMETTVDNMAKDKELERYKNIIKNTKEEIELYIDTVIDHLETNNEEINFELRNKCRAMREIKSEILEIIEKELKGE